MGNVEHRLASLPSKVGTPLKRLLAAGHLSERLVETVLDAGELANDRSKLLAFTAGMLYLQAQGIPVHDVIRMAKKQGRRVNLGWAPNRWKAEHERLSRAETLARLAQQNVAYDVSKFQTLLPESFSGYLIRNSRRLGMEGLRQRHCIASYHEALLAGHFAIASVFVDKQRWTVQLVTTGKPGAPLRIAQCRTRYNGTPSAETLNRIYELLRITRFKDAGQYAALGDEITRPYMENLRAVLPALREHGVSRVTVRFDGSGDSGSIDGIDFDPEIDANTVNVEIHRIAREFVQDTWRYTRNLERVNLHDAIEEITDDYLDATGIDWYNNDGGFGELVINVSEGTVTLEVNVRYTESQTEYSATKDIETGDEA